MNRPSRAAGGLINEKRARFFVPHFRVAALLAAVAASASCMCVSVVCVRVIIIHYTGLQLVHIYYLYTQCGRSSCTFPLCSRLLAVYL